ncbi:bifunctional riboflavin kinase/FAD synthetase [Corynebacterium lubricantis]|uniref:bifunctional riboflavin kinase/FAD synthetase n=1 Tax=Corynebacterium lubricantis TaxID=541095 RepID=UPI00036150D8|nr:bifunctional riboflavin kinase/FAD synthetase [Corynebacterium lubricantis]
MDIWYGLDAVPELPGRTVVTIGVFDGVHRGHQRLIKQAVELARQGGHESVVMTFDPHPIEVFAPERTPTTLTSLQDRAALLESFGVDHMLIIDFTKELAGELPEDYFRCVLVNTLKATHVVVGENFTFGAQGAGTAETMRELGSQYGVDVTVVELLVEEGQRVCSTYIREQLSSGNADVAAQALGRNFTVTGEVEHGAGRGGTELGYPTANQYFSESEALPADGVYAGWITIVDGEEKGPIDGDMVPGVKYPTAISIGTNPTFGDNERSVESFILDQKADLYGRMATVEFVEKVRDMVKFHSVDELLENMSNDVQKTRTVLGLNS